jgi:hypothetical protein
MSDTFAIYKNGIVVGVVSGEIGDLLHQMETDWSPGKGIFWEPLGFTLSDGRKVIRVGDYDEYIKIEQGIEEFIKEEKKILDKYGENQVLEK